MIRGLDQRIDLQLRRILLDEQRIQPLHLGLGFGCFGIVVEAQLSEDFVGDLVR